VAMTDNDRSALQDLADSVIGWAPSINAARAALIEIDELKSLNKTLTKELGVVRGEYEKRVKGLGDIIAARCKDLQAEQARATGWQMDYADAMTENSHLKCRMESSWTTQMIEERDARILALLDRNKALKAKLAAPPETLAITEIHNRLAKLENNAVNDRVFLGSVRMDVSDLERDVKSIGEDVITLEESTVPDMKARITNIEASVIDLRKPRTFTIV
jgi:hypothetical protein